MLLYRDGRYRDRPTWTGMSMQRPVGLSESARWQGRAGAGSLTTRNGMEPMIRDMVDIGSQGRVQCFCECYRFVYSFIVHLPPFFPTLIFLVRFFYIPYIPLFFFTRLLSLLRMFSHSPFTVQCYNSSNSLFHCRRTEFHATTCASLLDPTTIIHDPFDGWVSSALNTVSICHHIWVPTRTPVHPFLLYSLLPPQCWGSYHSQRPFCTPFVDNTLLHAYSDRHLCLFFTSKPYMNPDRCGRQRSEGQRVKRCLRAQRIWDEKGYCLAVGWAVWRRSYLNQNAIAASSGLGLSKSVETAQGRRRRRIPELYDKE